MREEGITFVTGAHVGVNQPAEDLLRSFDALVLACGSVKPRNLSIPGREGKGVVYAVDYLTTATKHLLDSASPLPEEMNARDKHDHQMVAESIAELLGVEAPGIL